MNWVTIGAALVRGHGSPGLPGSQHQFAIGPYVSSSPKAVFLSYASQDADAARHICDALRAMSVEVWFDQSALRGGDAWDASIRRQIKDCALFVPIISANTQSRERRLLSPANGNSPSTARTWTWRMTRRSCCRW